MAAWAEDPRCTVQPESLRSRLAMGWQPEDAITRTRQDQSRLEYTHDGRTRTLREWADQSGIKYHTFYNRIHRSGMTFEQALAKGPDGSNMAVQVTAFGETKPVYRWAVDSRAHCTARTIRQRLAAGWSPEQAITEEPELRSRLGIGVPIEAFGLRKGLEDWARHTQIPAAVIRQRMTNHRLPLEPALQSLGWAPATSTSPAEPGPPQTTRADIRSSPQPRHLSPPQHAARPGGTTPPRSSPPQPPGPRPRPR